MAKVKESDFDHMVEMAAEFGTLDMPQQKFFQAMVTFHDLMESAKEAEEKKEESNEKAD